MKQKKERITNLINNLTWYSGKLESLDRNSILSALEYKPTQTEIAKCNIENIIGIPYEEFNKHDIEEQRSLIEYKTGKKTVYDDKVYSTINNEKINNEIDRIIDKKNNILIKIKQKMIKK